MEFPNLSDTLTDSDLMEMIETTDQRTKSRLRAKRLYYKKRNVINDLQCNVNVLEEEYKRLLAICHERDAQPTSESSTPDSSHAIHHAYVQLTQTKSALVKENEDLKHLHSINVEMERQVKQLITAQKKALMMAEQEQEHKRRNPVLKVNPLTQDQCAEIARTSYREIKAFRESDTCFSTGTSVLGWRDRHVLRQNKLMFSLEKTFHGRAMDMMARDIWDILSLPEPIVIMRPRDAKVHFHVVQRLNEDAVVYYYTLEREDTDVRIRAFILAMRVDLGPDGCMVILRSLDPKTYLQHDGDCTAPVRRGRRKIEPHKENFWLDVFVWSFYEYAGEGLDDCKQTFGGEIEGTALASTGWWSIEILEMALRMESRGSGFRGLLRW
ncbi:hypothetical protein KXD40_007069 [Peronospora effusa]|uniref:Uncharacterized protein n=1 Tax=Peronospora effusa TaxID=542832 RepID=A0A3M6VCH1_9STRA|nr:hypothetical protein DD238_006126 [Peronospora effusa]RQM13203.1 hypothetical protein DD237_006216 [Peronospora effusa]UIZ24855.1 hypothetical protein KXD40_007069 [Peronospora effusa]CAI5710854.1 unnamed protein product [Peronospora effusa]